jgi:hypothetical protein
MNKYIVAYINFFDNAIQLDIFDAVSWRDALIKMLEKLDPEAKDVDPFKEFGDISYKEARLQAADMEFGFAVKEIR